MKGFIIALAIFLIIIILLFFYSKYISETFFVLSCNISEIENSLYANDFQTALKLSENLRDKLKKYSSVLYFLSDRSPIDNVIAESERLISFICTKDLSEASASARGINVILEKTKEKSILIP